MTRLAGVGFGVTIWAASQSANRPSITEVGYRHSCHLVVARSYIFSGRLTGNCNFPQCKCNRATHTIRLMLLGLQFRWAPATGAKHLATNHQSQQ
jgi:hypothetical protein